MDSLYYLKHVFFCTNIRAASHTKKSCGRQNSMILRNHMKRKAKTMGLKNVRINSSGCLDRCSEGPILVIYPEGVWYKVTNKKEADQILELHIKKNKRVLKLEVKNKKPHHD